MQVAMMGILTVLIGLSAMIVAVGWIVPLVLGIVGRRRGWASAGVWRMLAALWGAAAALLALAVGGFALLATRMAGSHALSAKADRTFDPAAHDGARAAFRTAATGALECVVRDAAGTLWRCAASNGVMAVPAGALDLRDCRVTAADAQGRQWTAVCRSPSESAVTVAADSVQALPLGPPFQTAVNVDWSPVSPRIQLAPVVADGAGNTYKISCEPAGEAPSFQALDASNRVVWSNQFEYG